MTTVTSLSKWINIHLWNQSDKQKLPYTDGDAEIK